MPKMPDAMPQIYPYAPRDAAGVDVEVQRLGPDHEALSMAPHGHFFFELILITGGSGRQRLAERWYHANERTVFAIPPGMIHDMSGLGAATGWAVLFLVDGSERERAPTLKLTPDVPASMVFDVFRAAGREAIEPVRLDQASYQRVLTLTEGMERELADRPLGYEFSVRAALRIVLLEIARQTRREVPGREFPAGRSAVDRPLLHAAMEDIDAHFLKAATLAAAARRMRTSPAYLTTRLRELTGRTYGQWIIERRMMEARHLLATTRLAVAKIADRSGYSEPESFIRRFKRHHGVTPTEWRLRAAVPVRAAAPARAHRSPRVRGSRRAHD